MSTELDYKAQIQTIFANNKLTDAQASLKHISKLLQGVNKVRQIPTSNFIVKKFVLGLVGGKELLESLGFVETTIKTTTYLALPDSHPTIDQSSQIAADLLAIAATNPLTAPSPATTETTTTTTMSDDATAAEPTTKIEDKADGEDVVSKKEEEKTAVEAPKLCVKGCGFYGSTVTQNMCSSCYKADQKKQVAQAPTQAGKPTWLNNLKPLGRPVAVNKNQCSTPKCQFHIWKDAPENWKETLLEQWQGKTSMSDGETGPVPDSSAVETNDTPTEQSPTSKPQKHCQYCSYNQAYQEYLKDHPKTLLEKRASLGAKARVIGKMASQMREVQHNKDRCWTCNRKLGITGIECKCGMIFCGQHRYPSTHNCTYDHMSRYTETLAKSTLNDIRTSKLEDDD